MSSVLIEHGQYVDDAGTPISGGKLYVGTQNADPVATSPSTVIYSDRALTIPIANPQSLGADGRALSKVWVDGEYSIQVNSLVGIVETQEFQDLDAGTGAAKASTLDVSNVLGVNVITGTTDAALSSLTANQQFIFTTAGENTTNITLNIDGTGARPVVKNYDQPILLAEFEAGQVVIVAYNEISNNFEWVNQNNKVVDFYIAPAVASAATTNVWVTDGNTVHVTGTTGITAFSPAASIGARRTVVFDGIVLLTHSADLSLPGGVNYTTVAGDVIEVYADTLTQHDVVIHKKDGTAVVATEIPIKAWVNFNGTGVVAIRSSLNVSSITDNGVGDFTVNFATAMADANYITIGSCPSNQGSNNYTLSEKSLNLIGTNNPQLKTTTQVRVQSAATNAAALSDQPHNYLQFLG